MSCKSRVSFTLAISPIIISLIFVELPRYFLSHILPKLKMVRTNFGFDISRYKINVANNMIVVVGKRALSFFAGSCSRFYIEILKWYCVLFRSSSNINSKKTTVSLCNTTVCRRKLAKKKHTCMTLNEEHPIRWTDFRARNIHKWSLVCVRVRSRYVCLCVIACELERERTTFCTFIYRCRKT